jgi:hypothetical protein
MAVLTSWRSPLADWVEKGTRCSNLRRTPRSAVSVLAMLRRRRALLLRRVLPPVPARPNRRHDPHDPNRRRAKAGARMSHAADTPMNRWANGGRTVGKGGRTPPIPYSRFSHRTPPRLRAYRSGPHPGALRSSGPHCAVSPADNPMKSERWNKCDVCGRFISLRDFVENKATRRRRRPPPLVRFFHARHEVPSCVL